MKIVCINEKWAHWGTIFKKDKEYSATPVENKKVSIVTDCDKYYHFISIGASLEVREWIRKGYTEDNLHEVVPGYLKYKEIGDRYTIKVELPFIRVIGDDKSINDFCTLTHQEISSRYNITLKKGKVPFRYTTYLFEEYFEYKDVIRNNKINELGI